MRACECDGSCEAAARHHGITQATKFKSKYNPKWYLVDLGNVSLMMVNWKYNLTELLWIQDESVDQAVLPRVSLLMYLYAHVCSQHCANTLCCAFSVYIEAFSDQKTEITKIVFFFKSMMFFRSPAASLLRHYHYQWLPSTFTTTCHFLHWRFDKFDVWMSAIIFVVIQLGSVVVV